MSRKARKLLNTALLRWPGGEQRSLADLLHSTIVVGNTGAGKTSGSRSGLPLQVLFSACEPGKGDSCSDDAKTR